MEPFTLRHQKALLEKRIMVSLEPRLRERIWQTIQEYNETWEEVTETNWSYSTNHLEKTEQKLKRLIGKSVLSAKTVDGLKEGMEAYFKEGYPSNVLEVVEQFYDELREESRNSFEKRINESMLAFSCRWLLSNGAFFASTQSFSRSFLKAFETSSGEMVSKGLKTSCGRLKRHSLTIVTKTQSRLR
jgi:hypothetical protein